MLHQVGEVWKKNRDGVEGHVMRSMGRIGACDEVCGKNRGM